MPPDPDSSIPDLNRNQLHVLQILWDAGEPLKPGDIEQRFDWPIENATLRSVLRAMVERGDLERNKRGKAYYYQPRREKRRALSEMLQGLAAVFAGGSTSGLLAQLLQEETLTPEERREIARFANSTDDTASKSDRS